MSCTVFDGDNYYDDQTGLPCNPNSSIGISGGIGPGNVNGGTVYGGGNPGVNTGLQTLLNSIFNTGLSTVALLKGRPYVPTTANPYNQPPPTIVGVGGLNKTGLGVNNPANTSITAGTVGRVETWIKTNPGVAGMIAVAVALFYMKPPARGR